MTRVNLKNTLILIIGTFVLIGGFFFVSYYTKYNKPSEKIDESSQKITNQPLVKEDNLTLQQIENAKYDIYVRKSYNKFDLHSIKLTNGFYKTSLEQATDSTGCKFESTLSVTIDKDDNQNPIVAFGDLNGDGKGDAVVKLKISVEERRSGPSYYCPNESIASSQFMLAVLINKNGEPVQIDQLYYYVYHDFTTFYVFTLEEGFDLSGIVSLKIENGIITIVAKEWTDKFKLDSLSKTKLVRVSTSVLPSTTTLNWKTYTDDALGFSFKYPPEVDDRNFPKEATSTIRIYLNLPYKTLGEITVGDGSFKDCIFPIGGIEWLEFTRIRPIEIMINSIPFYLIEDEDYFCRLGICWRWISYSTFKNNKCYTIHSEDSYLCGEWNEKYPTYKGCDIPAETRRAKRVEWEKKEKEILNTIISTFKFTK